MGAIERKLWAKPGLTLMPFMQAGVFRRFDHGRPLPIAAACFVMTDMICAGMAMAQGFSGALKPNRVDDGAGHGHR